MLRRFMSMSVLGKGWMVIRYFLCHSPRDAEVGSSHGALSSTFRLVCHSVGSDDPVSASHMLGLQAGCPLHAAFLWVWGSELQSCWCKAGTLLAKPSPLLHEHGLRITDVMNIDDFYDSIRVFLLVTCMAASPDTECSPYGAFPLSVKGAGSRP